MRNVFTFMHQLASVKRFSRDDMAVHESVLEHMGWCGMFAIILGHKLRAAGVQVNVGTLVERAIVHDIDEAVMGDIPRTTKYWNDEIRTAFQNVEAEGVQSICDLINCDLFDLWRFAKDDDVEGLLVRYIDIAAVVFKVWEEVILRNNKSFCRVARELEKFYTRLMIELSAALPPVAVKALKDDCYRMQELIKVSIRRDNLFGLAG